MDGSSPEGTPIDNTELTSLGSTSDVILLQAEITGHTEQNAETGASSQSPVPESRTGGSPTDLGEYQGSFVLRPSKKQVI